jgi:hypothetical protein
MNKKMSEENEQEIFKPVNYEDFGKYYEISNYGNVRKIDSMHELKWWDNNGYKTVRFVKPVMFQATVSRMVAYTFVTNNNPEICDRVNHIDENKHNNYYKNLEWVTQKENIQKQSKDIRHKKRVIQMDSDGNIIKTFDTINDAAKEVGVDRTTVSKVIVGVNQTAGGFRWMYEEDEKRPENRETLDVNDEENVKCLTCFDEILKNYYVTRGGRVYNKSRNIFLKPCVNAKGAHYVTLPKENGKKQNCYIQQLIATSFIPNPTGKKRVRHIDGDKSNNSSDNLQWF